MKIVLIIMIVLFFLGLGSGVYIDSHYSHTRPAKPQPEIGRIYPHNALGAIVYLNKQEDLQLNWLFWSTFTIGLAAGLTNYFYRPFKQNN